MEALTRPSVQGQCPAWETLVDFNTGQLPDPDLELVAHHLAECMWCDELLRTLVRQSSGNSLTGRVRECLVVPTATPDPAYAAMEAAAKAIWQPEFEAAGLSTISRNDQTATVDRPPLVIRGYSLGTLIGHGGMGFVYRAVQDAIGRPVALKVIREGTHARPETVARFRTEATAVARLEHPNVVRLYDFNESDGQAYFAMEFVEGGSLARRLADGGPYPFRAAAGLVRKLADAVEYAHGRKVLHRDLKPANVLIAADGTPKVTDFGLAKLLDEGQNGVTITDAVLGTPNYMAPEQAAGKAADFSPRTDVYGLGAILYEMLTGRPPFRGENKYRTLEMVLKEPLVAPSTLRRNIPVELEAICQKCLEKEPAKRYASAQELSTDLDRWMNGEPTAARPPGWFRRHRRGLRRAVVAVMMVGLLAGAAVAAVRLDPERPRRTLEAELAAGRPVTLIGETGLPVYQRARIDESSTRHHLGADGTFLVQGQSNTVLELLPEVPRSTFRYRVQVRHDTTAPGFGLAGLYVGGRPFVSASGEGQKFYYLTYNDIWTPEDTAKRLPPEMLPKNFVAPKTNRPKAGVGSVGLYNDITDYHSRELATGEKFQPKGSRDKWRTLEIEVSEGGIRASFEGQLVGEMSAASMTNATEKMLEDLLNRPQLPIRDGGDPQYSPRGGIGLLLFRGTASFRSAVVEPLNTVE